MRAQLGKPETFRGTHALCVCWHKFYANTSPCEQAQARYTCTYIYLERMPEVEQIVCYDACCVASPHTCYARSRYTLGLGALTARGSGK